MHEPHKQHRSDMEDTGNGNGAANHGVLATSEHTHVPVHYSNGTPARVIWIAVLIAAALAGIFVWGAIVRHRASALQEAEVQREAAAPVTVDVVHVEHAPAQKILSLPGQASSFIETTIYARVSGYLESWSKDIGDKVQKGQILAHIDTPELDDQYKAALAKVAELEANQLVAKASAEFALATSKRYKASLEPGAVSQEEVDQKQAELDSTNARVLAAKAQVDSGKAEVSRLETLQKFKDVVAPFDGVITNRQTDIGALVTAGSTTNTSPLFTISQSDQVRVFVSVPQPAVPDVKLGMDVLVAAHEFPGTDFHGKVDRTSLSLDPVSKMLKVQVLVPNPDLILLPGMYVTATFQTNRSNPPLRVPASALAFSATGPQVVVVDGDGRVSFREVKIARDLGESVEIASGLNGDENVALNVGSQVTNGERVQPHITAAASPQKSASPPVVTAAYRTSGAGAKAHD